MRNGLFWRLFWAFLGALVLTVLVMAFTMVAMVRGERQAARENEVRLQARDLAQLIRQSSMMPFWPTDSDAVQEKIDDLWDEYEVQVSRVYLSNISYVQRADIFTADLSNQAVIEQIRRVLEGNEIRAQGVFTDSPSVVTIGVPYYSVNDQVIGAVLLHFASFAIMGDYSGIAGYATIACVLAIMLGAIMAFWIARRQSNPLKQIQRAVADFAAGKFDSRVAVRGNDELARLAESFNQMAEDLANLEDSRRAFVANVSHELRSPMTSIQGYVQGLLDGTIIETDRARYLTIVLSETQRLTKLVSELLELSRFDSGKSTLNLSRFDVNALILDVMFKHERRIEAKGIDVEISFKEPQSFVTADIARITQVAENLIDNAVKYADEGGRITVWTHTVDSTCYATIKNTGPGISPDDMPFIFERFYKADKAHTSGMGTGLGLAIAKKIIEQHGQSLTATSGSGETSFIFTLRKAD